MTTPEPTISDAPIAATAPTPAAELTSSNASGASSAPTVIAVMWAVLAVIFGIVLLALARDESYGGDAYTGIQNAVMLGVRGIAFLLFGSAALGLIVATSRSRR